MYVLLGLAAVIVLAAGILTGAWIGRRELRNRRSR